MGAANAEAAGHKANARAGSIAVINSRHPVRMPVPMVSVRARIHARIPATSALIQMHLRVPADSVHIRIRMLPVPLTSASMHRITPDTRPHRMPTAMPRTET